jgi:hypothetical protein
MYICTNTETRGGLLEKQKVFFEMMQKLPLNTFRTEDLSDTIDELGSCIGKVCTTGRNFKTY